MDTNTALGNEAAAVQAREEARKRRFRMASAAMALSVLLHLGLIFCLPGLPIADLFRTIQPRRLVDIVLKEVRTALSPEETAAKIPAGAAPEGPRAELRRQETIQFIRPADTALIKPSPAPTPQPETPAARIEPKVGTELKAEGPAQLPVSIERQEMLVIEKKVCPDNEMALPRRLIPALKRIPNAPDETPDIDRLAAQRAAESTARGVVGDGGGVPARGVVGGVPGGTGQGLWVKEPEKEAAKVVEEKREAAERVRPIEKYLVAEAWTYSTIRDSKHAYCRIEIRRAGEEALPVLPKDIVLIQDSSRSIAEKRLHFCREGLAKSLRLLRAGDRFNIVLFRDRAEKCFPVWAANDAASREQASRFIEGMSAYSNTDIFASVKEFHGMEKTKGRPSIGILITDGLPTVGMTDSSRIIEEFSRLNQGQVSVFCMGTFAGANSYLLDLLSYRNRGDSFVVKSGRWDIPDVIQSRLAEVSRPVLADLRFRFSEASGCEAYPLLTSNLYLDRPLVLFGRYPKGTPRVVFQVVGMAGDTVCDMLFQLDMEKAHAGDRAIRSNWGWQKVLHLVEEYGGVQKTEVRETVRRVCREYDLGVPYRDMLGW